MVAQRAQKASDVLLVTDEANTVRAVSAVLGVNGSWSSRSVYTTPDQLEPHLRETPEAAVMVDIDPAPDRVLGELDTLSRRFSQARFIVLSRAVSSELVLRAMQAGARHFMLKSAINSELSDVLDRLLPRHEAAAPRDRPSRCSPRAAAAAQRHWPSTWPPSSTCKPTTRPW